jgi:F-type H+-transporting ATPase subunit gamma
MPNLKEVRTRIDSVNSTKQITSAMKMVAASKLRRAQNAIITMRPYAAKLHELMKSLSAGAAHNSEGKYSRVTDAGKVLIIPVTSNRGLCGAFNARRMEGQANFDNTKNTVPNARVIQNINPIPGLTNSIVTVFFVLN